MMVFNNYLRNSKTTLFGYVSVIPLFIIYEIGILFISSEELPEVRNGADVILRNILEIFHINGIYAVGLMLLIGAVFIIFTQKRRAAKVQLKSSHFLIMMIESVFWSILLGLIIFRGQLMLLIGSASEQIQQIILAIGSGLFEEFLFRVLLLGSILLLLRLFIKKRYWYKTTIAIIVSAIIFSYFHFIGDMNDSFSLHFFIIRSVAGIFLGYLYVKRGFGVVAYTHSIYNLFVLSQF